MRNIILGNREKILVKILLLIICLNSFVFAHGGRTDSYGGHMDNSVGIYHYHHGLSAHYHDNGICPYNEPNKYNTQKDMDYFENKYGDKSYSNDTTSSRNIVNGDSHLGIFFVIVSALGFAVVIKRTF